MPGTTLHGNENYFIVQYFYIKAAKLMPPDTIKSTLSSNQCPMTSTRLPKMPNRSNLRDNSLINPITTLSHKISTNTLAGKSFMNVFYNSIVKYMEQANDPGGKYGRKRKKPWIYL